MHALIIEDEYLIAMSVEDALRPLGYHTFTFACSAREAVESARQRCPDLIVADHRLGQCTGTDAVLTICSDRPIPVVFVTGSREEVIEQVPTALIVDKPFRPSALDDAIQQARSQPFTLKVGD